MVGIGRYPRGVAVLALVACLVFVTPVLATIAVPDGGQRLFVSDDRDEKPTVKSGGPPSKGAIDAAAYAKVGDAPYGTTKPTVTAGGTTLGEYRRNQLRSIGRTRDSSVYFEHTDGRSESSTFSPIISDAHITFMGIIGGAKPHLENGNLIGGKYPVYVGKSGQVLNFLDYRFREGNLPDRFTDSCETTTKWTTQSTGNGTVRHLLDGSRRCEVHKYVFSEERSVSIDGERIASGDDRVLPYDGLAADGPTRMKLEGEITLDVIETVEKFDWNPDSFPAKSFADGDWDRKSSSTRTERTISHTVSDSVEIHVTSDEALSVRQVVIDQGETSHVVISFDGPHSNARVSRADLRERRLLSSINFAGGRQIATTWGTYTVRRKGQAYRIDGDGAQEIPSPNVLVMRLAGMRRNATISGTSGDGGNARVVGLKGYDLAPNTRPYGEHVELAKRRPLIYSQVAIEEAPSAVQSVTTIHGEKVPVDVDKRAVYRQPTVTFEGLGGGRVRIHVEDPKTGAPIAGKKLSIDGTKPGVATTDANGNVVVELKGTLVGVVVPRDSLENPGDVFYDRVTETRTFLPAFAILEHLERLVKWGIAVTPLLLLLFWIRSRDLLV